ncbi:MULTISPECIES: MarR family winged helix-turn-helix transcriptional regulator [Pseudothermotoga]|uniref:MarR family winged helix-turn-helix transcriptional regulator n=1 Tax=Pseudothermotoga TaxID=1643951 RepID=UPI000410B93C|nr:MULTISPECIES: MarR family transcriptional regulator [Pseudothermotoga]KUK21523.1 MAG: Transcriptional regulator, TrmB [Pseudothermotoga lettingae]
MKKEIEKVLRDICFMVKVEGRLVLKDYPITAAQFDLLQRLYFRGPMKMTELSTMLGIAKSTLSGIVRRLENVGYLSRTRGKDKRVFMISATAEGKKVVESVIEKRVEFVGKVLQELGKEDSNQLLQLLQKFKEAIEKCRSS